MVTTICMSRIRLITKEKMVKLCKGKYNYLIGHDWPQSKTPKRGRQFKHVFQSEFQLQLFSEKSINDDLETLIKDIQLGEEPDDIVDTYFLPKLTKEELQLVEKKDNNFMQTLWHEENADVSKAEMEASESDSKYVLGWCRRATFTIENSFNEKASCSLQ